MVFSWPIKEFYTHHKMVWPPEGLTWGDFDWTTDACSHVDDKPFGWNCMYYPLLERWGGG
jgi:hypothetical protein